MWSPQFYKSVMCHHVLVSWTAGSCLSLKYVEIWVFLYRPPPRVPGFIYRYEFCEYIIKLDLPGYPSLNMKMYVMCLSWILLPPCYLRNLSHHRDDSGSYSNSRPTYLTFIFNNNMTNLQANFQIFHTDHILNTPWTYDWKLSPASLVYYPLDWYNTFFCSRYLSELIWQCVSYTAPIHMFAQDVVKRDHCLDLSHKFTLCLFFDCLIEPFQVASKLQVRGLTWIAPKIWSSM